MVATEQPRSSIDSVVPFPSAAKAHQISKMKTITKVMFQEAI